MIAIYGILIGILLCALLPPLFDRFTRNEDGWSWKRALAGYAVMTGLGGVVPVFLGWSPYADWLFVILAVAIAVVIAPVTLLGTSFVLLLLKIILPVLILWGMSRADNKVEEPMKMFFDNLHWTDGLKFVAPLVLGLLTFYVGRKLSQRFGRNERHQTAT